MAVATARLTASGFCGTVWGSDRKTAVTDWPTSRLRAASGATFNCLDEPRRAYMIGGIDAENCQQDYRMSSAPRGQHMIIRANYELTRPVVGLIFAREVA
jgi:hypothetical protein